MLHLQHHWETIKTIFSETIFSHVNGINAAVVIGAIYGQVILVVQLSSIATDIARWAQTVLSLVAVFFLAAYNILNFIKLYKSKKK